MKIKAVICGATFGALYIEAIKLISNIELLGIFSTGSENSKNLAKREHIKLFTSIEEIPPNVDIAFVAIKSSILGGKGTEIAKLLLNKKINVIQEHPVITSEIIECQRIAKKEEVYYKIGNLYEQLDSINAFIKTASFLNRLEKVEHISVLTSSQGMYSLMKILNESLNNFRELKILNKVANYRYPFTNIEGKINSTTLNIQVHNEVNDKYSNNYMHILHRIIFFYENGRLELNDTFGSVVWRSRMNILNGHNNFDPEKNIDMCYVVHEEKEIDYERLLACKFPEAIAKDICYFMDFEKIFCFVHNIPLFLFTPVPRDKS